MQFVFRLSNMTLTFVCFDYPVVRREEKCNYTTTRSRAPFFNKIANARGFVPVEFFYPTGTDHFSEIKNILCPSPGFKLPPHFSSNTDLITHVYVSIVQVMGR